MGSWDVTIVGVGTHEIDTLELESHDDESERALYVANAVCVEE